METKDRGILQKEVNVVVSKAPVLSPIFESVEVGTSLRDIFNSYSGLSEQHTKIYVNGEEQSDWDYVTSEKDYVSICQVPQGGSDDWLGVAAFVFPVFGLIPAAIYAGYQLYKMLDQPTDKGQGERLKRVTGARNEATPYEPIPVILGDRRVTPVYAAQPYTYWKGKEQWLKMLLCVGYGPLNISDIKIGDSPIWSFDDINYSVLDWNTTKSTSGIRSIWNKDIQQDVVNQELGKLNYISRSAPAGTDKITFEMVYPQGLWRTDDGNVGHSVGGFQFRYYVPGRGWYSVARIGGSSSGYVPTQDVVKRNGRYYIVYADKTSGAGNDLDFDITPWVDSERNGYAYIRDGSSGNGGYHYVNTQSYWHATRDELIKSWSFVPIDPITGARLTGDVPFEVKRNGHDYDVNSAGFSTTLQLNTITYELAGNVPDSYFGIDYSIKRYPVLIALDVRATEQLSGVIDNLNCRAKSLTPAGIYNDWKNFSIYNTSFFHSNNPAYIYKWALQGPFNGAAVDNSRIDNASLSAWYSECNSKGWQCNEIVNEPTNLKDLLNNIAFTGRAFFSMRDGKFSVIQNRPQLNPTQVFTTKNSRGLKSRREFDLETDGIKYTFANADFQEQEDEGIYGDPDKFYSGNINRPKPGAKITGRYEDFSVWGTTSPSLARKHARFAFFEKRLRREVYQLETDVESLIARRGDKVLLAHDVIDVGLGQGFIKEIDGYTFRIDETINLTAGQTYTLTIRSVSNGTQFYNTTATYQGDGWWSGSLPSYVEVGNLVAYGESGTQTLECLVTEITYSNNYEAALTLVNYADNLFTVDNGYLPEYESNLNPERPRDIAPLAPVISVNYGSFTYESNAITVNVSQQRGDRALLSRFSLQYKYDPPEFDENGDPIDIESDWQDGGVSPADDGTFRIPVSNNQGNVIYVRAKAVNEAGVYSPFSVEKKIELQNDPAPDVEDFTVTEAVDTPKTPDARWSTLTIEITPPEVMNGYLYAIAEYRQPGQDTWATIGTLGWKNPNSIDVQVYADGRQYEIRVRSASIYGVVNKNGLSKIITTTNTSDPEYTEDNPFEELPAPNVRGLELFDQGNDTEFTGRDAKFTWRKSTLNDWVDLGYEGLKGASNAVLDQYFRDYEVEIIANDEVVRTENVVDNIYTYTYEKNAEDYERRYGVAGAYRDFRISVTMRTRQNQESDKPAVLDVANPAPEPLTGIELIPGFRTITVSYNRPTDLDYQGVEVWVGTETGFDVNDDTLVYDGPDTEVVIGGLETDTQYYIILRPYDAFGKVDIFSTELTATTLKIVTTDLDNTKPDTVTNVAATTNVYDNRLQSTSYIDVTWDAVTNTRIANYTIDINGESQYTVAGTSFRFTDAIPGEDYTFKVRANSFTSIEGDFSTPVTISAAVSSVAPAVITNASVSGGLEKVVIEWTNPNSENFYSVGIYRGTTAGFVPSEANKIASVVGSVGSVQRSVDTDVVNGTTYYYKLIPETLGGVQGSVVNAGSATPNRITPVNIDEYLEDAAIVTDKIANNAIDLSGNKITGQLQGINLADAAVDSDKLADLSVDASKIANGSVDLSGNKITGQLQGINLADAAVDSDKLADLSVEASKLVDGAVTTTKIANLAVGTAAIANGAITNAKIGNAAVDTAQINDAAITSAKIEDLAVGTAAIANGAITNAKIKNLAVSTGKIQDAAITNAKIGNAAVDTAQINDAAIVTAKIKDAAIISAKIGNAEVKTANIADLAVTNAKISTLDAAKITTGTLDADRIGADTITSDKINVSTLDAITADMGTLTAGKISVGNTTTGLELDTLNGIRAWNTGTQTLHFKPDGTGYIGASQDISWDGSGNVNISGELGAGSIFTNGQIKSVNGGVEVVLGPKDFGAEGVYLLSGTNSVGDLVFGVDENGNATFDGKVTITGGSQGIANFSDAGSLATKSSVDWSTDIIGSGKPQDNATYGADWTSTLSNIPDRVSDTATVGLNLTDAYLGYYDGTAFRSYIQSNGSFHFGSSANNFIDYNGSKLAINTDNFTVDPQGNATFSGNLNGASGTFSGELQAATGVLGNPSGNRVEYDGTNLIVNTPEFSVDASGNASFSGEISGATITGGIIRTAASGKRVEITETDNSLSAYNSSGVKVASIGETVLVDGSAREVAVFGEASASQNYGVYGKHYSGGYGVYGDSNGQNAIGVFGISRYLGGSGYGVSGISEGRAGVYGHGITTATGGRFTSISNHGCYSHAMTSSSAFFDFYAGGTAGTNYGPFTGGHDGLIPKGIVINQGDILVAEKFEKSGLSQTIPYVDISRSKELKSFYGVFVGSREISKESLPAALSEISDEKLEEIQNNYLSSVGNALGEGQINVCSQNGDFEIGDFICTSSIPGKGMRYDGQDMRYVVARCMEPVTWAEEESNIKMVACIYMCG
ncbi:fibronectin type III domain-containing protein [Sinomicrobium sp.]